MAEAEAPADPETAPFFRKSRGEIPPPLRHWNATVVSQPGAKKVRIRLTPRSRSAYPPDELYFFSTDGQVSSNHPQVLKKAKNGSLVLTCTRAEFSPKEATTLPGVLWGRPRFEGPRASFGTINPTYPEKAPREAP